MIKILVTGANGQLGKAIEKCSSALSDFTFLFTDKEQLNIEDEEEVKAYFELHHPNIIVNCAGYTNVDLAEDEIDEAYNLNCIAVGHLAKAAIHYKSKLIHISTDYVFDGTASKPIQEETLTNPQNQYGASKMCGEHTLKRINPENSIIIRTSWLYGETGTNFVKTMLKLGALKDDINVVNDQFGRPTYAHDLANALLNLIPKIKNQNVELFHYANSNSCSWFEFAEEIMIQTNQNCKVNPVGSDQFKTTANRPKYSVLDTEKIQKTFNIEIPHWKDALGRCLKKIV